MGFFIVMLERFIFRDKNSGKIYPVLAGIRWFYTTKADYWICQQDILHPRAGIRKKR
jgi:hypothetical protein